ncbi:hypothetical protein GDO86_016564 [Hymenochirus boettgeri]|uniref:Olfactory receptor n=1 Tax=Hymenochirus boettgeri TaxID=247094 RepID=A0A8T2K5M3_9PIPI|nr:hypothetical protein GDO86_016564 [Hymenochirus boettgeri]
MFHSNQTAVDRFILLGLADTPLLKVICVLIFLTIYILTLSGNFLLILAVRINSRLHTPMYYFLTNLSVIDIGFSSYTVPKLLITTLAQDKSVSLMKCATELSLGLVLGATEFMILAVMSYDRYVAICKPLHYSRIMSKGFCISMAAASWIIAFVLSVAFTTSTFQLRYCSSFVNHFFCEIPPLLRLSCEDPWINEVTTNLSAGMVTSCSFFFTLISYMYIISAILRITSTEGRLKVFFTCASHLTVVIIFYSSILLMYLRPRSRYFTKIDRSLSIFYAVLTPVLNPIIYSVRNKDVKTTLKKKLILA